MELQENKEVLVNLELLKIYLQKLEEYEKALKKLSRQLPGLHNGSQYENEAEVMIRKWGIK